MAALKSAQWQIGGASRHRSVAATSAGLRCRTSAAGLSIRAHGSEPAACSGFLIGATAGICVDRLVDARAVGKVPPQTGIDAHYPQMVTPSFRYDLEYVVIAFVSQQHPLLLELGDDEGASASDVAIPHGPNSSSRSTQAQR